MTPQQEVEKLRAELAALHAVKAAPLVVVPPAGPVRLDLGCGNTTRRGITGMTKEKGWTGVDLPGTDGADVHADLAKNQWPWPDSSVDEINCAHMVEHIPAKDLDFTLAIDWDNRTHKLTKVITWPRVHFFNELWRVMKPGAKANLITPHWASCRAYGDITHEWPPVSEMFWQYLDMPWREVNAPHVGFSCKFDVGYGYITAAWLHGRNNEYITHAVQTMKEAAQDMQATLTARK